MGRDASAEDEVTRLAAELVRIDSSDPGAYEGELERFVRAWLAPRVDAARAADGTPLATLEELEALPGRTCLRATILAAGAAGAGVAGPGPADLTLCCHMDTVQLGDGWSVDTPALGGIVRDGKLWGRGSCDMKGGLACAMLAFSDALDAVRRRRCAPERSVSLLCTVDEEDVMRGCEAAIRAGWLDSRGWVLDTEPTDSLARDAHKGRTWFELDMSGVTAHASTPWKGADAVAALSEAICHVRRAFQTLAPHASLGTATVTFGQVEGGYSPYVVPGFARVWIDMRLVPPYDTAWARHLVEQAIAHAEESVPGVHPDSELLAALRDAARGEGYDVGTGTFTGYTDTAVVAGICRNRECLSYGPGSLEVAHKPNEHVPVADLVRVRAVLSRLACSVVG